MEGLFKKIIESGVFIAIASSIFIVIGFISKFANNRVLGIQSSSIDTTTYIEQSGNFFLQSIQVIFHPIWNTEYLELNFIWLCLFIILVLILIIIKYIKFFNNNLLKRVVLLSLIIVGFLIISTLFNSIIKVESVLQPKKIQVIKSFVQAMEYNVTYIKSPQKYNERIIKISEEAHNNTKGLNSLFSVVTNENDNKRKETYLTIIILGIFILIMLWISFYLHKESIQKIHKYMLFLLVNYFILFLSYTHGVLGTSYNYPIADLEYKIGKKDYKAENVIILENNSNRILFLNRLNYMKIIEIPYTNVSVLEQKAKIKLFKNCSQNEKGEIKLCEEYFL